MTYDAEIERAEMDKIGVVGVGLTNGLTNDDLFLLFRDQT